MVERTSTASTEQALAHALETLTFLGAAVSDDLPPAQIVARATQAMRERVEAVRYNAWARATTLRSKRRTFARRHKGHPHA